jgi:hypothetical protein
VTELQRKREREWEKKKRRKRERGSVEDENGKKGSKGWPGCEDVSNTARCPLLPPSLSYC